MWRPRSVGRVIAERRLRFVQSRRSVRIVSVRFGRPVQSRKPERGDPWWCPVEVVGLGKRSLRAIAGEDSVQALVLALEFVTNVLPVEAQRAGGHLEWLGERERLVFANTFSLGLAGRALQNLVDGLASAISVLENGARRGPVSERQLAHRLRALIVSGGYTSDPRGLRQRSNNPLRGSAARAMLVSAPKRQR
jgi:Domain of unknown function (DUF6968)